MSLPTNLQIIGRSRRVRSPAIHLRVSRRPLVSRGRVSRAGSGGLHELHRRGDGLQGRRGSEPADELGACGSAGGGGADCRGGWHAARRYTTKCAVQLHQTGEDCIQRLRRRKSNNSSIDNKLLFKTTFTLGTLKLKCTIC